MFRFRRTDHRTPRNRRRETELTFTTELMITVVITVLVMLVASGLITPEVFAKALEMLP